MQPRTFLKSLSRVHRATKVKFIIYMPLCPTTYVRTFTPVFSNSVRQQIRANSTNFWVRSSSPARGDCIGRADRQVRRGPTVAVGYILKPRELIYPTSTVLFYAPQMPKKKATSKRKAKQRDEEETLEAAPAESPAPSARRSTRSTIHLDDDGPSVTPRSEQVELVESDKTDSAHPLAEKLNWCAVCADERKGAFIEASAFRCSPPPAQAIQTLPRLSLCLHACAGTVFASDDFPLLSLSSPGTSTRSAASGIGGGGSGGGGDGGGGGGGAGGRRRGGGGALEIVYNLKKMSKTGNSPWNSRSGGRGEHK